MRCNEQLSMEMRQDLRRLVVPDVAITPPLVAAGCGDSATPSGSALFSAQSAADAPRGVCPCAERDLSFYECDSNPAARLRWRQPTAQQRPTPLASAPWTEPMTASTVPNLKDLLRNAQLPALPQSAIRLLELSQNQDNGPTEFAQPIEADPGLT